MKKGLIFFILISILIIVIKFSFSNYNIEYKVDNYNIKTVYKNKRFYYEIIKGDKKYNFDIYANRKITYSKIKSIKEIDGENYNCIYPTIEGIKTYPLCYVDDVFTDYYLIESEDLEYYKEKKVTIDKSDKDFVYFNTLDDHEYVALWNYKGYIVMNKESYKIKNIFTNDKYDNTIAYLLNDTIYMSNNDEEHEYTSLIGLNLTTLKAQKLDLGYNIDYDSYIVGHVKNYLYIFDNKYSVLYEINVKNGKTSIKGNNEKGFVKYENGKFVSCSKTEYKIDKIKYNNNKSNYKYTADDKLYKIINDNKNIKQVISNEKVNIISESGNNIYYLEKDRLYKYNPINGSNKVFYNYELSFNSENTIFVYNK